MAADETTERELTAKARTGDADAFQALLARAAPAVRAHVERRLPAALRRKIAADDVVQEASLVAFRRIAEFEDRGEGAFAAWLSRIAELKLREAARRYVGTKKRGAAAEISRGARPDTDAFRGRGPSPSEVAIAGELRERAARALAALPADYRDVLRLVQIEGVPIADAAARMGRSPEAARKLYGRALARFGEALEVEEVRRDER